MNLFKTSSLYVVSGCLKKCLQTFTQLCNPYYIHEFRREYCTFLLHKFKITSPYTCFIGTVTLDM